MIAPAPPPPPPRPPVDPAAARLARKSAHYEVISISVYCSDLARWRGKVAELKAAGDGRANLSKLIRYATNAACYGDTLDLGLADTVEAAP